MDCYCDYDPPIFYNRTLPRSRKKRRCYECDAIIGLGERYERVAGMWDGGDGVTTFHTCERCVDLRQWVENNVPCLCWAHGSLDDDLDDAVDAAIERAPDETRGLRFGFLRRKILRDRHARKTRIGA
jgi:hypothetical protein